MTLIVSALQKSIKVLVTPCGAFIIVFLLRFIVRLTDIAQPTNNILSIVGINSSVLSLFFTVRTVYNYFHSSKKRGVTAIPPNLLKHRSPEYRQRPNCPNIIIELYIYFVSCTSVINCEYTIRFTRFYFEECII